MPSRFSLLFFVTLFACTALYSQGSNVPGKPVAKKVTDSVLTKKETDIDMVYVKGGTFYFEHAAASSIDSTRVTVSSFYMGIYEVTQKQWKAVMHNNNSYYDNCNNCPVENVSWNDVQDFITSLNELVSDHYRLPTEAEWEFAAKGGVYSEHHRYSGSNNLDEVAWYSGNSLDRTHPVGRKKPNELGIYDMTGNVDEWCGDWDGYPMMSPISSVNPKGPLSGYSKIWRGGNFSSKPGDTISTLKFNHNGRSYENTRYRTFGFRLVRDTTRVKNSR